MESYNEEPMYLGPSFAKPAIWNPLDFVPVKNRPAVKVDIKPVMDRLYAEADRIVEEFNVPVEPIHKTIKVSGMEIGDDRGDVSNSPRAIALGLSSQESLFKMKTSWKDTTISRRIYNLCEVTSSVPTSQQGGLSHAKKESYKRLQFVDSPPLRILIGVQKGDRSHSSSSVGKAQMLGSRTRSSNQACRPTLELANWLQDGYLNTSRSPDPKYLPWAMGGSSAPALWAEAWNTYLYVRAYKGGTYGRVYGSATNELRDCVREMDLGNVTQPVLCSHLRMKQDYLHITYGSNVAVPQVPLGELGGREVKPLYKAIGGTSLLQGVENRLVQAGELITATGARAAMDASKHAYEALFGYTEGKVQRELAKGEKTVARREFGNALQANSAVQSLLQRDASVDDIIKLCGEGFYLAGFAKTGFSHYDAVWLESGGRGEAFSIMDLLYSEDMYLPDEVLVDRLLKVPGIPLTPNYSVLPVVQKRTTTRTGLWQVSESMLAWAHNIVDHLRELRGQDNVLGYQQVQPVFYQNREWVSDDSLLVDRITQIASGLTSATVVLVSSDIKLARVMAKSSSLTVALVHPIQAWINAGGGVWSAEKKLTPQQALGTPVVGKMIEGASPVYQSEVLMDTGSIAAYLQNMEEGAVDRYGASAYTYQTLSTGYDSNGKRTEVVLQKRILKPTGTPVQVHFANGVVRKCVINLTVDEARSPRSGLNRVQAAVRRFARR